MSGDSEKQQAHEYCCELLDLLTTNYVPLTEQQLKYQTYNIPYIKQHGNFEAQGPHYGRTLLHWSCLRGEVELTKMLIDAKANIEVPSSGGGTPLHLAATLNRAMITNMLLEAGAHVDAINLDGWTALHKAALLGNKTVLQTLLDHGADPLMKTKTNETAKQLAKTYHHDECHALLEEITSPAQIEKLLPHGYMFKDANEEEEEKKKPL